MSWRLVLSTAVRVSLVISVALSGMTFSVSDAEARRGGKVRASKEHSSSQDSTTTKRKSDDENHHGEQGADSSGGASGGTYVPRVRSREAARGAETSSDAEDPTAPKALPRNRVQTVRPVEDLDVAGCPTGMICTVCVAGCQGDIGGIVNAQVKTPIPAPRH
jgi:hypothetical protein